VAKRAGVSAATVSRVLNGSAGVQAAKRDQVLTVVEEIGYRANRVATNMRRQQTQMVGVVVPDVEDTFFSQMVRAVEDTCYEKGYRALLCNTDGDPDKQRRQLGELAAERVAGVIIAPAEAGTPEISELIDNGAAVVTFDSTAADPRAGAVLANAAVAARLATEHLIAGGHTKIGFLGGTSPNGPMRPNRPGTQYPGTQYPGTQYLAGYEQAIGAAGSEPFVAEAHSPIAARSAATVLIDRGATGLVIASDQAIAGVVQWLRAASLRPPGDIAIVTLGEPIWAELTEPPLTTLCPPIRVMARAAVELVLQRPERRRKHGKSIVFEFELRHRGSCCQS